MGSTRGATLICVLNEEGHGPVTDLGAGGAPSFEEVAGRGGHFVARGDWTVSHIAELDGELRRLSVPATQRVIIDLSGITALDTAGAWLVHRTAKFFESGTAEIEFAGGADAFRILLEEVARNDEPCDIEPPRKNIIIQVLERVGIATVAIWDQAVSITGFFGLILTVLFRTIINPRRLRLTSMVYHMEEAGWNAIPIVTLLTFLIGAVLAYQGSVQLRNFGAEVFTVDLISISILREIGVLITAIIVAGRSGSAFTAQIGSMKVHEEVDAMQTLALDPIEMLVLPRILALVLTLPLLVFGADIAGLAGGALVAWVSLGISPTMFISRFIENTDLIQFWIGIIKAPFFAFLIGMVGCYEGLKVEGSAESVGQRTTQSVVESIFLVIIADALFSIFFVEIGW